MSVQCTAAGDKFTRADTTIGGTTNRTLAAWVRKTASSDAGSVELNYNSGVWGTGISTFAGDMYLSEFSNVTQVQYLFAYSVGTWYHLAITYDGTNAKFYKDGALVQTSAWNSAGAPAGTDWNIGQNDVELQDVAIFNAALTIDEIQGLMRERQPRRRTNLVAHFPFFAGSNRTLDYSGNARNLTSAGSPADGADSAPAVWSGNSPRRVYIVASALALDATGTTQVTGSASVTSAASAASAGLVQTSGTASMSKAAGLVAGGTVQTTGSVVLSSSAALVASGLVQTTGSAALAGSVVAAGNTQVSGTAALTAAAGVAASGTTQTTGTANVGIAYALTATGVVQTSGGASATAAASLVASGLTQTFGNAAFATGGGGGGRGGDARNPGSRRHATVYGTRRRMR